MAEGSRASSTGPLFRAQPARPSEVPARRTALGKGVNGCTWVGLAPARAGADVQGLKPPWRKGEVWATDLCLGFPLGSSREGRADPLQRGGPAPRAGSRAGREIPSPKVPWLGVWTIGL